MKCPICNRLNGVDKEFIKKSKCNKFNMPWDYCPDCELYYTDPPRQEFLDDYYTDIYWPKMAGSKNPFKRLGSWLRARSQYRWLTNKYYFPRVLDIGCGDGALVKRFNKNKMGAVGIDYRRPRIEFGNKYNLIIFSHSLEHARNPIFAIDSFRKSLQDNGRLFIEVPLSPPPEKVTKKYLNTTHITNYTEKSIGLLLEKAGFEIEELKIIWWFSIGKVMRIIARKK